MSPRRTTALALALVVGVLSTPASAGVLEGPFKRVADVTSATAVAPRPIALETTDGDAPPATPGQRDALRRRLEEALVGSTASVLGAAVDVEGYGQVLRRDAASALPPASTQKTYVALSALLALGPGARYRTEVAASAPPVGGRVAGHLWLVAGGDPYLTSGYLRLLARSVREKGITRVDGDLLLDDMRYDQKRTADGWKSGWMPRYTGPLSALAVDRNAWRTDPTFLADPAFPAAVLFRDHLQAEGVTVAGTVRRLPRASSASTVAVHNGTPLPAAVKRSLEESDNFAAELLLKELGRVLRGDGSSLGGLAAVRDLLDRHGVPVGAGADGSGLSSYDRQTPAGQVLLLQAADRAGTGAQLREALPLGCREGTLKRRYCGTPAEGRVMAKTGTLSGVRALAGYTRTKSGREVWFAFQLRGVTDGAKALAAIDRAVVALASSTD